MLFVLSFGRVDLCGRGLCCGVICDQNISNFDRLMMNEIEIFGERPINNIYGQMMNRLKNFRKGVVNILVKNKKFNGRGANHAGLDAVEACCKSILNTVKKSRVLKVNKSVRRAKVIGLLQNTLRNVITKLGLDALNQMTSYSMLSITEKHKTAFKNGLGFEIGMYLFSRHSGFTNPLLSSIEELVSKCRLHPKGEMKTDEWFPQSIRQDTYKNLFDLK